MRGAEEVTFGGSGLDRAAAVRASPDRLGEALGDPRARVLPIWRGNPLFAAEAPGWVPVGHPVLVEAREPPVFLGLDEGRPAFASDISAWAPDEEPETLGALFDPSDQRHPSLGPDHRFAELRGMMTRLSARDAELTATARALTGWQRDCPDCGAHHFPRTDPVVIMLVTSGDSLLVGRSPHWPPGMYSLLAGFVEPGETIEAAVRREVWEEAGVRVGNVRYLASQPWPFPASLMFGCAAEALGTEISRDPAELEDALWLTRQDLVDVFAGQHPRVKPARSGAIAHFLMRRWLADRLD